MLTTAKTAKADAEAALRDAFADPRESTRRAEAALGAARAAHDPTAESLALQALGLAARLLGDVATAVDRLQESVRTAENAGLHRRAAEARITLSLALTMAGRTAAALDALDTAARALTGSSSPSSKCSAPSSSAGWATSTPPSPSCGGRSPRSVAAAPGSSWPGP